MKLFNLLFLNLRVLRKNNRLFLIAILLAQCVAIWILLFGIAAIQNALTVEKEIDEMSRYFDVYLLQYSETETENKLIGYSEENGTIEPQYAIVQAEVYDNALALTDMIATCDEVLKKADYIEPESIWFTAKYGEDKIGIVYKSIKSSLTRSNDPLIEISPAVFPGSKVGDRVYYGGREYIVDSVAGNLIGKLNIDARFAPEECICYELQIILQSSPTTEEAEDFSKLLGQYYHYSSLYVPETIDPLTAQFHASSLTMCGLMMLAVILNLCYAQMYIFQQRRQLFAIYRLCGASQNSVKNICLAETEVLGLLCLIFSALLFHFIFEPFVTTWYSIADGMYTLKFYIIFGLAYLLSFYMMLAVPLAKLVHQEVIAVEREK